ncbi:allantoate permease [Moniliophthora roreri MCA 2997]|uniref:Allantoate permease n=1 Tax=Moniliophthora roreri (strain MCA 2997) TaxID=1381753 RepID=V2XED7_MONRO|nr:allantoate permease [Moniliophthora roreri MCA 2997]
MSNKNVSHIQHLEDIENVKDPGIYSVTSGSTDRAPAAGIDAEVAEFFARYGPDKSKGPTIIDEAENTRLRWMIHKRVLVVMVVTYFAQALDKGTINFASIMGIREDTNLHGQQYAWLTTCIYIAILVWEFPTNRLIQRLPIGKYLGFNIMVWGMVLAFTAMCKNFVSLLVVRTLLGVFECVCQPAFVFLSTMWYKRDEQALVIGSFYSMNGFQQCVGGLIAYGIFQVKNAALKNWQILFLLLGALTFVWGLFVTWYLPDTPIRAKCWSPEDRVLMLERVRENETGVQNKEFKAFRDPTVWAVTIISFTNGLPTGGLGAFSNILLNAFGFTILQTYLLAIAQGVIIMSFLFSAAWLSKKYGQRLILAFIYTLPNVAGTIVFLSVPISPSTKVGLLLAFYCTQGFGAVATLNLATMSGNIAGRSKQVIASSMVFVAWAVGNAVGPQVFRDNDGPRYIKAFVAHIVIYGIQLVTIALLRIHLMRLNVLKRRAQDVKETKASGENSGEQLEHNQAFDDLTDRENPDFRYVY